MVAVSLMCKEDIDAKAIQKILLACPQVSKRNDQKEMLPLHFAVAHTNCDEGIISTLLHQNPYGVCEPSIYGDTPLHVYMSNPNADPDVLAMIVQANPKAVR